ncbi:MAG: hypothetical protein ABSE05_11405 [Syntrophales bacterium]
MDVTNIIAFLGAMSLSVERVVEIIKNMVPFLANDHSDPKKENYRTAALHAIAALAGAVIAYVAQEQIQPLLSHIFPTPGEVGIPGCIIVGFLASGGSGFWNQCLSIVGEVKKAKELKNKS